MTRYRPRHSSVTGVVSLPRRREVWPYVSPKPSMNLPAGVGAVQTLTPMNRAVLRGILQRNFRAATARELA